MRCHQCAEPAILAPGHRGMHVGLCRAHLQGELLRLQRTVAVFAGDLPTAQVGAE